MVGIALTEEFIRTKMAIQEKLSEIGDIPGSREIESQVAFIETRMKAKIKQDMRHSIEKITELHFLLNAIARRGDNNE